jgi:serine protease Do
VEESSPATGRPDGRGYPGGAGCSDDPDELLVKGCSIVGQQAAVEVLRGGQPCGFPLKLGSENEFLAVYGGSGRAGCSPAQLVVLHNGRAGVGAGVLWKRDGLVVTNHHVVAAHRGRSGNRDLRVEFSDGRVYPARVTAQDEEVDLALLQVEGDFRNEQGQELPEVLVADVGQLRVGELVMAIGHPWGQRGMVTLGMVSGIFVAKTRGQRGQVEIIRSDARLAPGNSGGPLVDASGAVVGLNTLIIGGDQGMAISSKEINSFVEQSGKVQDR